MGEGERPLCLQAGGCRDSDGTKTCITSTQITHSSITAVLVLFVVQHFQEIIHTCRQYQDSDQQFTITVILLVYTVVI